MMTVTICSHTGETTENEVSELLARFLDLNIKEPILCLFPLHLKQADAFHNNTRGT